MTNPPGRRPREDASSVGGGSAAVLRAIGSLLVALSGSDEQSQERAQRLASATVEGEHDQAEHGPSRGEAPVTGTTGNPPQRARDDSSSQPLPGDHPPRTAVPPVSRRDTDDIEWLLADARARAQQILDESMTRAEELMTERSSTSANPGPVLAEIHRTVDELVEGMTDVRERLARIEALIEERRPATEPAPEPAPPARPDRPSFSVVSPDVPRSTGSPAHEERRDEPPPPSRIATAGYVPAPAPGQRTEPPPAIRPDPVPPPPERPVAPPPRVADEPPPPSASSSAERTAPGWPATSVPPSPPVDAGGGDPSMQEPFDPERGAILLRVSPVAGFQGLMRVQDALGRLDAIRQATVEAYAQGEARLRLELAAPIRADRLAADLGRALDQLVHVRSHSITERSLQVTLE